MSKRITIIIDDDLNKKIRIIQAKNISEKLTPYSFSKTLNDVIRKGLK